MNDNPETPTQPVESEAEALNLAEADMPSPEVVPTQSATPILIALLIILPLLAFGLGIGSGYLAWGRVDTDALVAEAIQATQVASATQSAAQSNAAQAGVPPEPPTEVKRYYEVTEDDDYILGPDDAPITIIEFSDYQCPYCKRWYDEVFKPLQERYPGQIRFVYRDFPLTSIHPEAVPAANAANCAGEQGQYYDFHTAIFEGGLGLNQDAYLTYAGDLGLDVDEFTACVQEDRYVDEVMADLNWAAELGIQSTPTFFINGIPLVGAQPLETFTMLIDWELDGKLPK